MINIIHLFEEKSTKAISRDHYVDVSPLSRLITVAGGKWTTYRLMAQDVVDRVLQVDPSLVPDHECQTIGLKVVGAEHYSEELIENIKSMGFANHIAEHIAHAYGDRSFDVVKLCLQENLDLNHPLVSGFPYIKSEVLYCARNEFALTAVDFLARRSRLAFLDSGAAWKALDQVIELMGNEFEWTMPRRIQQYQEATDFLIAMGSSFDTETTDLSLRKAFSRFGNGVSDCILEKDISAVVYSCTLFADFTPSQCRSLIQLLETSAALNDGKISLSLFSFIASLILKK